MCCHVLRGVKLCLYYNLKMVEEKSLDEIREEVDDNILKSQSYHKN